jgi:hypothetical protein
MKRGKFMKLLKKILCFILVIGIVLSFNSTKSVAAEVKYTENVIPTMTSDTSPSGKASASSNMVSSNGYVQPAYLAFDHSVSKPSCWGSAVGSTTGWLEYEFTDAKCITKYTLQPRNWPEYVWESPKDWTFEAWDNEKNEWVALDTQKGITDWSVSTKKEFPISNTTPYNKYRINVGAVVDDPTSKFHDIVIGELEMMETVPAGADATICITMVTGEIKEYHLEADIKQDFLTWYDDRSNGSGKAYYTFTKDTTGGFLSRKEYLSFDKISSFEVMEYN